MSGKNTYKVVYRSKSDRHEYVIFVQSINESTARSDARKQIGNDFIGALHVEKM